jgi:hypothetical protein
MMKDGETEKPDDEQGYCTQLCCKEALPCGACLCEAHHCTGIGHGFHTTASGHTRTEEII